MIGSNVAKVVESKDPNYPVGSRIVTYSGWVKRGKGKPAEMVSEGPGKNFYFLNWFMKKEIIDFVHCLGFHDGISIAPELGKLSPSHLLGACGMPGNTAYFALTELCQPKPGN